jgi:hypothetical protein
MKDFDCGPDGPGRGYDLVFVHWIDSCEPADNSDINAYELPTPQNIFQSGFMVHEEEDHIVVAGGLKPECETYDYVISIPRCAVISLRRLGIRGDE